jgi:acyl carrier protein
MDTRQRVIAILAEQALRDPEEIRDDMTLADLGIDSLGLVETLYALEEGCAVAIPFNANEPLRGDFDISSVGAVVAGVERLVAAQG